MEQLSTVDPPQRVALYTRVSTDEQAERQTIQDQRDFLRNFANLYDLTIVAEYSDEGISGTVPLSERPDGSQLLKDSQYGRFDCVLLYRVDCLGRSLVALLEAYHTLTEARVTIRSVTEPFDTATPIGNFLFQLLGSLAELEKSTIVERMTLGRDRVARDGLWTGGPIPFGYDIDEDGRLIPSQRVIESLQM
ncbi:MAG: recombinase family protein, partial [Candidatus Tectomicrobia bacterium]|nr:recombinase family protein [Candidatus Tectomicrobia bacterium]